MNATRRRWTRAIATGLVALGLTFSAVPGARAQEEGGEGEASEGRPLDGYFGTAALAGFALFVIGKSARR